MRFPPMIKHLLNRALQCRRRESGFSRMCRYVHVNAPVVESHCLCKCWHFHLRIVLLKETVMMFAALSAAGSSSEQIRTRFCFVFLLH